MWCDRVLVSSFVEYCLCTNPKQFYDLLKSLKVDEPKKTNFVGQGALATTHVVTKGERVRCVVCINLDNGEPSISVAAILVHEAMHIWREERMVMGEKEPSSEFEAYAIQRISYNLMMKYAEALNAST